MRSAVAGKGYAMAAGEGDGKRAGQVAAVLRPLGHGPLSRAQAVVAGNLLGVHWTTVYRLRRRFRRTRLQALSR
jgi:putative transposase